MHEDREPLVLVHGLSGSPRWWRRVAAELAPRHDVRLVELPGFDLRRRGVRFDLARAADWLAGWAESAGFERMNVAAHSMGAVAALRLAAARPDVVRRLVLVAPAGVPAHASMLGYAIPLARTLVRARLGFLAMLAGDAARAGPLRLWRATRELLADDVRAELARVRVPTLLVWGERDHLVPPSLGEIFRTEIPDARLVILPGAGHVPMVERPRELADAIDRFLAGEAVVGA